MRGPEITKEINEHLTSEHQFVKWWRKENDFLDFDLINRFMDNLSSNDEIGGIDLLTMEEMWREVKRVSGDKVKLVEDENGKFVGWLHESKEGLKSYTCKYTPENLMNIFDSETRGNPIH